MQGNRHLGLENPLDERVAIGATQHLTNTPEAVDDTADPGIGHAYHRQTRLHGPKLGIGEMLACPDGMFEPTVIGQRHQKLCSELRRTAGQISQRVLEADQGPQIDRFH